MSRCLLLGCGADLIDAVAERLNSSGADCTGNLVIFPGKRPAHFLRKVLAQSIGKPFLPPSIVSIDDFIDRCYEELLGRHDRKIEEIDAIALLYDLHCASSHRVGGEAFTALEDFLSIGSKIYHELEELQTALVPPGKVRELDGLNIPFSGVEPLSRLYEKFYSTAASLGYSTRGMRYAAAGAGLAVEAFADYKTIITAGFYGFMPSELELLQKLSPLPQAWFMFQEGPGIEKTIAALGLEAERVEGRAPETKFEFISSPDVHGEIFAVSRVVEECRARLDERTVIVLPDAESLFPLLHESLAPLGREEYNISLGYPLERTPAFAFLNGIMEAITSMHRDMFHAPDYFKLVLHPYTKNIRFGRSAEATRVMFHAIEEEFAGMPAKSFFTLCDVEGSALFDILSDRLSGAAENIEPAALREHLRTIHDWLLRPFLDIASVGDFCRKCIAVLEHIHAESTANRHVYFQPFVETLANALEKISLSMLGGKSFREPVNYVNFIRRCVAGTRIPFEGTPLHGLQVLGFLETRCLSFDRVIVLDANDDLLPGSRGADMLLPQQVREHLGLETYRDRERLMAYYFHQLVRNAGGVSLVFLSSGGKERSRFVEKILWELQQADKCADVHPYIHAVKYAVSLGNTLPGPKEKTSVICARLNEFTFSPSILDMYLHCPLKFYYAYIAGLEEKSAAPSGTEQSDIGSLVHEVLAGYFMPLKGVVLAPELFDRDRLDNLIDRSFTKRCGDEPAGMKFLLKRQIKEQLGKFICDYQLPIIRSERVIIGALEQGFGADLAGRRYRGYADRIEMRGDRHYILDYKTGANETRYRINFNKLSFDGRETWGEALGSLQLPLYALMYSRAYDVPLMRIEPVYVMIGRNELSEDCEVGLFKDGEASGERFDLLSRIISALVEEMNDSTIPFHPTTDPDHNCPACPYRYICGTQWKK